MGLVRHSQKKNVVGRNLILKKEKTAVCKPGSVEFRHLSTPVVAGRLYQPTLRVGRATLKPRFIWSFNPWGLPSPASLRGVVSSYLAFSPLPASRRYLFCGTFRSPRGLLPVRKHGALCCPDFPLLLAEQRRNNCCFFYIFSRLMCQHVLQNVGTHLQRLLVSGLRVVVYARVLPAVAKVAFVGEQAY